MDKTSIKPHLLSFGAIAIFSTIEVVGKLIGSSITPYAITAWRFLIGGLIMIPFAFQEMKQSNRKLSLKATLGFILAGILNVCLSMLFLQLSIYHGKAVLSAVIISSNPIFVTLFAIFLARESINRTHVLSLIIGLSGLCLIIFGIGRDLLKSQNLGLGVLFGMLAALTFGLYTVFSKQLVLAYGNLTTLCATFLSGSLALLLYSGLAGQDLLFSLNWRNIVFMGYLSLFVTWLAYIMYFSAIRMIGAAKASFYFFLKPAIAGVLAWLLLGEHITLVQFLGILLIMISLGQTYLTKLLGFLSPQQRTA